MKDFDLPSAADSAPCVPSSIREHLAFQPYRDLLQRLPGRRFPTIMDLNTLLPEDPRTVSGQPLRFVDADGLVLPPVDGAYEREINANGRVSTRPNRHDVCNALVWARFPRLKAMLNARHVAALPDSRPGRRGAARDAITLFDECGGVVISPNQRDLEALAAHDWQKLFGPGGEAWPVDLRVVVIGHGTLAKFWQPYKSMTGHCILLQSDLATKDWASLDTTLATLWRPGGPIRRSRDLCPVPFMGMPGWWPGETGPSFYADTKVFRPPRPDRVAPPVYSADS